MKLRNSQRSCGREVDSVIWLQASPFGQSESNQVPRFVAYESMVLCKSHRFRIVPEGIKVSLYAGIQCSVCPLTRRKSDFDN